MLAGAGTGPTAAPLVELELDEPRRHRPRRRCSGRRVGSLWPAFALPAVLLALAPFHASSEPLPAPVQAQLKAEGFWRASCPVGLSDLRLLTVSHWGFDGRAHTGQLVVNARAAGPLAARVPQALRDCTSRSVTCSSRTCTARPAAVRATATSAARSTAGRRSRRRAPAAAAPAHGRCTPTDWRSTSTRVENPYVGCGQSRDPAAKPYFDRSRHRRGMVTPRAIAAFRSVGWGWGGAWAGRHEGLHALLLHRALSSAPIRLLRQSAVPSPQPPSITISCPVMYSEAGDARKRASGLMSSGQPTRCMGMTFEMAACCAGSWA